MAKIRKRSRIAKRGVGGTRTVIVKELNGFWTISVPQRVGKTRLDGNYWNTLHDVPHTDVLQVLDCIEELMDEEETTE